MKESVLYPYYLVYLESKSFNNNTRQIMKISETHFSHFCLRMTNDIFFKEKINSSYLEYQRNKKINILLNA